LADLSTLAAGSILASLILYTLLGGADFGGGVWDLLARGPRANAQKRLVAHAIAPVWETSHIWVIIAVVLLFTGFPEAYSLISTALFVPVTLMLFGIVLRGGAFAFHSHHLHDEEGWSRWGSVFAGASLVTPLLLGAIIGAVSSGGIRAQFAGSVGSEVAWLAPFPLSVGLLTLAIFSHLAAVYLIFETGDHLLREDFRIRGLWSSVAVAGLLVLVPLLARGGGPDFYQALMGSEWSAGLVFLTATAALGAHVSLLLRNYPLARVCAAAQAVFVLSGWGAAQYPFIVRPDLTIPAAASPSATLRLVLIALGAGALFLFPAIFVLFRVFKKDVLSGRHLKS
jgi:cytochrome d ubiquinol oxidase subunit II